MSELIFSTLYSAPKGAESALGDVAPHGPGMDKGHKILLDALGFASIDLEKSAVRTGAEPQTVSSMVPILELEGHVQAAPGGHYSPEPVGA